MRALVVGGGPAGTTAAIALGRAGIESLVVEKEDRARPVGVGLALQNSPLRALHQLGLLEAVVAAAITTRPCTSARPTAPSSTGSSPSRW
jgi:2-polyprenyl-6-methoxyphenol hydroxylase-like FAD-dependent oxidoreductase